MVTQLLIAAAQLAAGFVLLIWAADRLVAGSSALAQRFGISPLVIGITIVGFGTSAPEMVVSGIASFEGNTSLAIGNALGSNIANIGLILGLTAIIYPLSIQRSTMRREFPALLMVMAITALMMANFAFSRLEGLVLLLCLAGLITFMVIYGRRHLSEDPQLAHLAADLPAKMKLSTSIIWTLAGIVVLPVAAHILVTGAVSLATWAGVSEAVIGLTVVALGTSLPELAAAAASALKKEDDLAIGNILGSNIFNLLGVLGISAVIAPLAIETDLVTRDLLAMFLITGLLAVLVWRRVGVGQITRVGGFVLLGFFVAYQAIIIRSALFVH